MNPYINKALAQQIVNTVKDLCGQNVNFIECSGRIFASTDQERIGRFHEIARQAAVSGKVLEVTENDRFTGTQKGVNLPIYHNHEMIAVIGITGNPDEIRKYAHLAERITHLLIREKELDAFNRTEEEKKNYILKSLIGQESVHPDYLSENLSRWNLNENSLCHLIRLDVCREPGLFTDSDILQLFQKLDISLHAFIYPNQYLAVLEHSVFISRKHILKTFAEESNGSVLAAVGSSVPLHRIHESSEEAETVLKSLRRDSAFYGEFEDLTLELILSSVDQKNRDSYLSKTIGPLSDKDRELLEIYFQCNMSLKDTCEKTFLHKNTLQYRLNQIHQHCGYNPRSFRDAVVLYLALKL